MEENKVFVPHELKTVEIDVEKKIFRINGEDFGKDCTSFSIDCEAGDSDKWFKILARIHTDVKYANYDFDGKKTSEKSYQLKGE